MKLMRVARALTVATCSKALLRAGRPVYPPQAGNSSGF